MSLIIELETLDKKIKNLGDSLDASYEALSGRLARLENQKHTCEEDDVVHVTFSRVDARQLYLLLNGNRRDHQFQYDRQMRSIGIALGYSNL